MLVAVITVGGPEFRASGKFVSLLEEILLNCALFGVLQVGLGKGEWKCWANKQIHLLNVFHLIKLNSVEPFPCHHLGSMLDVSVRNKMSTFSCNSNYRKSNTTPLTGSTRKIGRHPTVNFHWPKVSRRPRAASNRKPMTRSGDGRYRCMAGIAICTPFVHRDEGTAKSDSS